MFKALFLFHNIALRPLTKLIGLLPKRQQRLSSNRRPQSADRFIALYPPKTVITDRQYSSYGRGGTDSEVHERVGTYPLSRLCDRTNDGRA